AAKIALRTQQIIAYESGVTDTVDPLAGSFFVETLTDEIEAAAFEYIKIIDSLGGAVAAIEKGFMQDEISKSAYDFQKAVENGDQIVVGVNKYIEDTIKPTNVFRVDDSIQQTQSSKLEATKNRRSLEAVEKSLADLEKAARSDQNTMPFILEAVESYATVGE